MADAPLVAFFNGAYDLLRACFDASRALSNASKGGSRETAARELLRAIVPPVARVESGDVIDSYGHQTGQLDAVVVDHRAPTLKLAGVEPTLILAEGALVILEVKSSLRGQWREVLRTYEKVAPIRPWVPKDETSLEAVQKVFDRRAADQSAIPFVVVAGKGWTREQPLREFLEKLKAVMPPQQGRRSRPVVLVVTLAPPFVGLVDAGGHVIVKRCSPEIRGETIANVWYWTVNQARMHSSGTSGRRLPLQRYFRWVASVDKRTPEPHTVPSAKERSSRSG